MIILGVDPGTATTGYGVINSSEKKDEKENLKCIDFGCIETKKDLYFPKRLILVSKEIRKLVKLYRPSLAAIEKLFFFKNHKTAISVSQSIGVIILTLERMKIPIVEYSPLQVKKNLTNNGRSDKKEVQKEVEKIYTLEKKIKKDDAADALAIATYAARDFKLKKVQK